MAPVPFVVVLLLVGGLMTNETIAREVRNSTHLSVSVSIIIILYMYIIIIKILIIINSGCYRAIWPAPRGWEAPWWCHACSQEPRAALRI